MTFPQRKNVADFEEKIQRLLSFQAKILWTRVFIFSIINLVGLYGIWVLIRGQAKFQTVIWFLFMEAVLALGITMSAHRYWSHKTFKAKPLLKILLAIMQTCAFQNSIRHWVRNHRLHHKYSDTDADPHNASRGFFFSHAGWLLCEKHPSVIEKGREIDLADLDSDYVVRVQDRFYLPLGIFLAFVTPTAIPCIFWDENVNVALYVVFCNYVLNLHKSWLVNSAAHLWGNKPYDKSIKPTENWFVSLVAAGEGWHNYHHVFPWNYKTEEFGMFRYSRTTAAIELFAALGLAYDLKTVGNNVVESRALRTGDGFRKNCKHLNNNVSS